MTFLSQTMFTDQYLPLIALQQKRQLIEVKISGDARVYQTLILSLDLERELLWLDDLFPSQHLLNLGDEITLRHHRNGEQLCFSSPVVAWGDSDGASGLAILLPENISYQPRRQNHRCDVGAESSVQVKFRAIGQEMCYGALRDLSLGGLRLSVAGNLLSQLRHGTLLPFCELRLSDELQIRCSARIRSFRLEPKPHRSTHISVEFIEVTTEARQQLEQFMNNFLYFQQSTVTPKAFLSIDRKSRATQNRRLA
jgi:c-di-GMP-binding flagellar brake protein YcgR